MRMPSFADLDKEQRRIYQGAPPDGSILVVGPPGTGKTVMAFHRAGYLREAGQQPQVIMFNKVLSAYVASENPQADSVDVSTLHSWISSWFRRMGLGNVPTTEPYVHNWNEILTRVQVLARDARARLANWGHLIVDEGQDFPAAMYSALALMIHAFSGDAPAPALTVFADENQRLSPNSNSTVEQIRRALRLTSDGRSFHLSKNYRNTRPIAEFAAHYYCGLPSGIAAMPTKKGPKPSVSFHAGQDAMIDAIINFVDRARDLEIGIICPRDKTRKRIYNKLSAAFEDDEEITVQSYSSRDPDLSASELVFDTEAVVTVLNYQSAKGLEFDAVIIVDPLLGRTAAGSSEQQFRMNMYVMCTRAREQLRLMFVSDREEVLRNLPMDNLYAVIGG
jgi:DNA helicase-2/ATP-dependent DNA helicase PcrA